MQDWTYFIGPGLLGTGLVAGIGYIAKAFTEIYLKKKTEKENKKREVYMSLVDSMDVFIEGRDCSKPKRDQFLYSYSQLWLWASDDVILSTNELLKHQISLCSKRNGVENNSGEIDAVDKTKIIYAKTVLKMRKDLGYKSKRLTEDDYQYVSFFDDSTSQK